MAENFSFPESPLTDREERIIEANSELKGEQCPECDRTVDVCDLSDDGTLYINHTDDEIGKRKPDSVKGCRVDVANDPTL